MDKEIIGKRIRRQREQLSLIREEFSEKVGISPQFLAEIENGKKGMSAETLYKICDTFGISADYILLGRQSANGTPTPAMDMLCNIPTQYTSMVEDILSAFNKTIEIAESKWKGTE